MTVGCVAFGLGAARATERHWQILYQLNFFICLIAAGLYLLMATGYGAFDDAEGIGTKTTWIRYVTWGLSTPLLILDLTFLGRSRLPLVTALVGANTVMILTGFIATVLPEPLNFLWYVISCGAFVAIALALVGPYRAQAKAAHPKSASAFDRLVTVHLVIWTLYPVVWILSVEGLQTFGTPVEAMLFTILDVVAKVGFGFLALNTLKTLVQNGEVAADTAGVQAVRA